MAVPEEIQKQVLAEATSATPNYSTDYSDERFTKNETEYNADVADIENTYGGMIESSDKFFNDQIQASKDWADKQAQAQQDRTDFTIEKIEQDKAKAEKDYKKEQSAAYVDWQKQSNQYGANAEKMASAGLDRTGFTESSQVSMYNTYQNRVATARESFNQAVLNYNNSIKDAQLQNNAVLAEIAANAFKEQAALALEGFQYKNNLIIDMASKKTEAKDKKWQKDYAIMQQQNWENEMAEKHWQYEDNKAWQTTENQKNRDFEATENEKTRAFQKAEAEIDRKHDEKMAKIEQDYKIAYLNASTEKEKEKATHDYNLAVKLEEKKLANDKALLKYEYGLKTSSSGVKVSGSSGSSGKATTSYSQSSYNKKVTNDEKKLHGSNTSSTSGSVDYQSILNLGYGPISASRLAQLVSEGKAKIVTRNGKMYAEKVATSSQKTTSSKTTTNPFRTSSKYTLKR